MSIKKWTARGDMVADFGTGLNVAEVGVWRGEFSQEIIQRAAPAHLTLIDGWTEPHLNYTEGQMSGMGGGSLYTLADCYAHVQSTVGKLPQVEVIRAWSLDAASKFPDGHFDWVYIDANHMWDGITADLPAWWPKVKDGGWLCGHDYRHDAPAFSTVHVGPVVDAWATIIRSAVYSTHSPQEIASWAIRKK